MQDGGDVVPGESSAVAAAEPSPGVVTGAGAEGIPVPSASQLHERACDCPARVMPGTAHVLGCATVTAAYAERFVAEGARSQTMSEPQNSEEVRMLRQRADEARAAVSRATHAVSFASGELKQWEDEFRRRGQALTAALNEEHHAERALQDAYQRAYVGSMLEPAGAR